LVCFKVFLLVNCIQIYNLINIAVLRLKQKNPLRNLSVFVSVILQRSIITSGNRQSVMVCRDSSNNWTDYRIEIVLFPIYSSIKTCWQNDVVSSLSRLINLIDHAVIRQLSHSWVCVFRKFGKQIVIVFENKKKYMYPEVNNPNKNKLYSND
jgi:hypothetical protein